MLRKICKINKAGVLGISIPKEYAAKLGFQKGGLIDIEIRGQSLIIKKVVIM